jgi:hypothetical protein
VANNLVSKSSNALVVWVPTPHTDHEVAVAKQEDIPAIKASLDASLLPTDEATTLKHVAVLFGYFDDFDKLGDKELFLQGFTEDFAVYPPDVQAEAIRILRKRCEYRPKIAQMVKACEELMKPRRAALKIANIRTRGARNESEYHLLLRAMSKSTGTTDIAERQAIVLEAMKKGKW